MEKALTAVVSAFSFGGGELTLLKTLSGKTTTRTDASLLLSHDGIN
jgi:hypothetical protein